MRDISISRAKPAIRLTIVSPPIVPVDLMRFMKPPRRAASGFGGRRLASARAARFAGPLLLGLSLSEVGSGKVDRIEQQRREAEVRHRFGNDLAGEWEEEPGRFDQEERRKRLLGHVAKAEQ